MTDDTIDFRIIVVKQMSVLLQTFCDKTLFDFFELSLTIVNLRTTVSFQWLVSYLDTPGNVLVY